MYNIRLPHVVFPAGAMEYPLCIDIILAVLMTIKGIDYRKCYASCAEVEYCTNGNTVDRIIRFPMSGLEKYRKVGIRIDLCRKQSDDEAKQYIQNKLFENQPAVVHFDAYYCPWDKACYGKRHNDHLVMVTGISWNKRRCKIVDPYFGYLKKTILTKRLFQAMRFWYKIEFPQTMKSVEPNDPLINLKLFFETLNRFSNEVAFEYLHLDTELGFMTKLYRTLQAGRVSLYFYRLYLMSLNRIPMLCSKLKEADCLWVNCLLYIVRGARTYYSAKEMKEKLKELSNFQENLFAQNSMWKLETTLEKIKECRTIDLRKYLNCKMFLSDEECEKSTFIEHEKLCISPVRDIGNIIFEGKVFRLLPQEREDNIRCNGQKIDCRSIVCKGISLLMVAEWIDITGSIRCEFKDGDMAETQITVYDFPKYGKKSVDLGEAYDTARWKAFDHVYAQVIDIAFLKEAVLCAINLPQNTHLHLLSAVAVI